MLAHKKCSLCFFLRRCYRQDSGEIRDPDSSILLFIKQEEGFIIGCLTEMVLAFNSLGQQRVLQSVHKRQLVEPNPNDDDVADCLKASLLPPAHLDSIEVTSSLVFCGEVERQYLTLQGVRGFSLLLSFCFEIRKGIQQGSR